MNILEITRPPTPAEYFSPGKNIYGSEYYKTGKLKVLSAQGAQLSAL